MIKTVQKFCDITGFNRGDNYPSFKTLMTEISRLKIECDELQANIMGYFLYDGNSE